MNKIVDIHDFESRLKRKIRKHFKSLGYQIDNKQLTPPDLSIKNNIRDLHSKHKEQTVLDSEKFLNRLTPAIYEFFANGNEINPRKISPKIERVKPGTFQNDLFRLAGLTWSVPVSSGYGRRLRFLVWDEFNNKLIGIFALGDPSINLKARDEFIGWNKKTREEKLVNVMDSYIVGAVPPYNKLLCGKLISCLLKTKEIVDIFKKEYGNKEGEISEKNKKPKLTLITTSSSLGKSSIYNRLTLNSQKFMIPVSYTDGWGHFHFSQDIMNDFDELLRKYKHKYYKSYKFRQGANYKIRKIKACLSILKLPASYLKHQIKRELYFTPLANNYLDILNNKAKRPDYSSLLSIKEVSLMALDRWVIKRAKNDKSYKEWNKTSIKKLIFTEDNILDLPLFESIK